MPIKERDEYRDYDDRHNGDRSGRSATAAAHYNILIVVHRRSFLGEWTGLYPNGRKEKICQGPAWAGSLYHSPARQGPGGLGTYDLPMNTYIVTVAIGIFALGASAVPLAAAPLPHSKASVNALKLHRVPKLTPTPMPTATPIPTVTVPGGTAMTVNLVDKVSSHTANVGDTFAIVATQDVVVDGWLVVAKGASGQGEVVSVERAGSNGHAGNIGLQMDWIFATDGEKLKLTSQKDTQEGQGKAGAASTVTVASYLLLGLPGLFAHNFVKGRDIDIDSSKTFPAYVQDTVHVAATQQATVEPGFAH